jgi:hypothetical protein
MPTSGDGSAPIFDRLICWGYLDFGQQKHHKESEVDAEKEERAGAKCPLALLLPAINEIRGELYKIGLLLFVPVFL